MPSLCSLLHLTLHERESNQRNTPTREEKLIQKLRGLPKTKTNNDYNLKIGYDIKKIHALFHPTYLERQNNSIFLYSTVLERNNN